MSLGDLAASLAPPFAMAGIALARPGRPAEFHLAAAPGIAASENTLWRAASLSKLVTARTLEAVAGEGVWDRDSSEALGFRVRHPRFPDAPITLGLIASHASGLSDDAGYAIPADTTVEAWLRDKGGGCWLPGPPGSRLRYCNLGSVLLALAAERRGGDTFDRLTRRVLDPLGIEGGFAWSGVAPGSRADRLPAFRRGPQGFVPQVDARVAPDGPSANDGAPLAPNPPGRNPSPLAPQGGLRLSLAGALRLALSLPTDPKPRAALPGDPLLEATAPGLLLYDDPSFYPRPLVGHFANAYGILAGAWRDRAAGAAFAYVLNGLPQGDEDDAWHPEELAIFAALAQATAQGGP